MSDLDLTEAVEAAARGLLASEQQGYMMPLLWEDMAEISRHNMREAVRPLITAAAPLIEAQVREQVIAELRAAVGDVVAHKGGSGGVYERSPNGTKTDLWGYGNAVAYTGAVMEVIDLIGGTR